mgnify:CR=1 FL=1|tara:strand:+ start:419 stop:748 length:330 start_codon:yes stop_codon:yes gene_type:complete
MLKKLFGKLLSNLGYISMLDYNTVIYENVNLQQEVGKLSQKCLDLERLNKQISNEMKSLVEENNSLWDMLDEMKASETFGQEQYASTIEDIKDMLTDEMMKDFKPIGDA